MNQLLKTIGSQNDRLKEKVIQDVFYSINRSNLDVTNMYVLSFNEIMYIIQYSMSIAIHFCHPIIIVLLQMDYYYRLQYFFVILL